MDIHADKDRTLEELPHRLHKTLTAKHPIDEPYVLSPDERSVLTRTKVLTIGLSVLLGVLGVGMFFMAIQLWPSLLLYSPIRIGEFSFSLPFRAIAFVLIFVLIETNLLVGLNLLGAKTMMQACQFPEAHDPLYETHLKAIAHERKAHKKPGLVRLSLDPYLALPTWGLLLFFLLNTVKVLLSSVLFFVLLKDVYRPSREQFLLVGVVAVMHIVWNTYASWTVLRETQLRIMAPQTIHSFLHEWQHEWAAWQPQYNDILREMLYISGIFLNPYNYAHHVLYDELRYLYGNLHQPVGLLAFIRKLSAAPVPVRQTLERLLIFCVVIDGKISIREKHYLKRLRAKKLLSVSLPDIERIGYVYWSGRGLWV